MSLPIDSANCFFVESRLTAPASADTVLVWFLRQIYQRTSAFHIDYSKIKAGMADPGRGLQHPRWGSLNRLGGFGTGLSARLASRHYMGYLKGMHPLQAVLHKTTTSRVQRNS
jgi:hypothetical protein